jgi:hypothetical protein
MICLVAPTITNSAGIVVGEATGVPGNLIPQPSLYGIGVFFNSLAPHQQRIHRVRIMDPDSDHTNGYEFKMTRGITRIQMESTLRGLMIAI